jgi:hypothetical protein
MRETTNAIRTALHLGLVLVSLLACATQARADDDSPLREKTLVAWVRIDDLEQTGTGVLAIQDGDEFDAVVFGERVPRRWMAGSHMFGRTQSVDGQASVPAATSGEKWHQVSVVYRQHDVEIYQDDNLLTSYSIPRLHAFSVHSDLYLGLRCIFRQQEYGHFCGAIDEARIYDRALSASEISQLEPGTESTPEPWGCWTFDGGSMEDRMGRYPAARLVGTARVKNGQLLLDGAGYALITHRIVTEYKPPTVQAGFYTPPHRVGQMWDTWLYWHDGTYYMYYISGPGGQWDAHEIARSRDGVYWDYQGVAVKPRAGTTWIGTGHVWRSPDFRQNHTWILNFSEWVGDRQDIMFATSPDLLHWTKVEEKYRFVQDTRWYRQQGRWDCIDVVSADDDWLYGYFTADPDPEKVGDSRCGFGCARSRDGICWEALPPPRGDMNGEFGGIQRIGDRYFITMSEGRVGVGTSPEGPFLGQRRNPNMFGGDIYFPRFFHTAPDSPLVNHFYTNGLVYAAPLKAVDVDEEGVLRLMWWRGNEKLKAAEIPTRFNTSRGQVHWIDRPLDVNQTIVLEGSVHLPKTIPDDQVVRGLLIDQGNGRAECVSFGSKHTALGEIALLTRPIVMNARQAADRGIDFGSHQRFRAVLNRDMLEVYVNDYLTITARVRNTGRLGLLVGEDPKGIDQIHIWRSASPNEL